MSAAAKAVAGSFIGGAVAGAFAWRATAPVLSSWYAKRVAADAARRAAACAEEDALGSELAALESEARALRAPLASAAAVSRDAPAGLWTRDEFIAKASAAVVALSDLLDAHVADAFLRGGGGGGLPRAAAALRALLAAAEDAVAADVRARRDALAAAALGAGASPEELAAGAALPAVALLLRALLAAALDDAPLWVERARAPVDAWLAAAPGWGADAGALGSDAARAALTAAFAAHAALTLWPLAADANLAFVVGPQRRDAAAPDGSSSSSGLNPHGPSHYDADAHVLFSADGAALPSGKGHKSRVTNAGPVLVPREPQDADRKAASAEDIQDVRAGAKTLVVSL
jgi:hypothetical protein